MRRRTLPVVEPRLPAMNVLSSLRSAWQFLRQVTGDDAYERYRAQHASFHGESAHGASKHQHGPHGGEELLSRRQFFKLRQDEKWSKVSRCC